MDLDDGDPPPATSVEPVRKPRSVVIINSPPRTSKTERRMPDNPAGRQRRPGDRYFPGRQYRAQQSRSKRSVALRPGAAAGNEPGRQAIRPAARHLLAQPTDSQARSRLA